MFPPHRYSNLAALGTASFAPTDIAGLALWLKADAGTYQERTGASATTPAASDADPVGSWLDQSGNARHATAAADSKRPALKLAIQNGKSVVRLDGVDDYLVTPSFAVAQPVTVYLVLASITYTSTSRFFDGKDTTQITVNQYVNTPELSMYAGTSFVATNTNLAVGTFGIVRAVFNGASSSLRVNAGTATTGNPGANGISVGMTIGARYVPDQYVNADIAEVLVYGSVTAGQDTSILTYLNGRYATY